MGLESFYGGKSGFSFIIVKSFSSVAEMVTEFKKGPKYNAVHFDEHVIINTANKNNSENGRLYRRGYDYTNDLGGAIYICTIVGPAGQSPLVEMTTVAKVKELSRRDYDYKRYSEGSYAPTANLVPGKTDAGAYNDSITWACCSVRNEEDEYTTAYIGFIFPYLVTELVAKSVDPYYNRDSAGSNFTNTNLALRIDDKSHPYYEKWQFNIPRGIKGDTFKNLKVVTANSSIKAYPGKEDDIANGRKVFVYEHYSYDKSAGGEFETIYLGDYNVIRDIKINDEGDVEIFYTHDDKDTYNHLFKWIDKITLDSDGHFKVEYNQKDSNGNPITYETYLKWVNSMKLSSNGTLTLVFNDGTEKDLSPQIQWIDDVYIETKKEGSNELGTGDQKVHIIYNTGRSEKDVFIKNENLSNLDWNSTFVGDLNIGQFLIEKLKSLYSYPDDYYIKKVYSIEINVQSDSYLVKEDGSGGHVVVENPGTDPDIEKEGYLFSGAELEGTSYFSNLIFHGDRSKENKFSVLSLNCDIYQRERNGVAIGEPLNYILETAITDNYHLIVYYSDPVLRQKFINSGTSISHNGKDGWYDLGSVKSDSGILIGLNIDLEDNPTLSDIANAISYLNAGYPNGLIGADLQGKIATIGNSNENKKFYAFDYTFVDGNYKGWYYLGNLGGESSNSFMLAKEDDLDLEEKKAALSVGGIWFLIEEN